MADSYKFVDAVTLADVLEFASYVGGPKGAEDPDFGSVNRQVTRTESPLVDGAEEKNRHDSTRLVTFPIKIQVGPGIANPDAMVTKWREIAGHVNAAVPRWVKCRLHGTTLDFFWDVKLSSKPVRFYKASHFRREPVLLGELLLTCGAHPLDATKTPIPGLF